MTGYVKIYKPDMRFRDYETYKSVYCGMCENIGKEYSPLARLTLSYDYTLLAMVYMSLSDKKPEYRRKRCVANPLKKCYFCSTGGEEISYSSAVSMVLLDMKVRDNIADSGFWKRIFFRILGLFTVRWSKKAIKKYPHLKKTAENFENMQRDSEADNNCSLDKASHPTGVALGEIFKFCSNNRLEQENLYRFGYCLGKWIYLTDAVDDLEKDMKSGNFNPLKNIPNAKESCAFLLNSCETECAAALDLLDIRKFKVILENIVFQGLKFSKEKVIQKEH